MPSARPGVSLPSWLIGCERIAYGAATQFFGAFVPPVNEPSELAKSQPQDIPPKQSGEFGVGVWHERMSRKPPSGFVLPPLPPLQQFAGRRPGMGLCGLQSALFGSLAQSRFAKAGIIAARAVHMGSIVAPPPVPPPPQVQTPSFGLVGVVPPPPPGSPGMPPPVTADACTHDEPFAALQKATTPSHLPVVS